MKIFLVIEREPYESEDVVAVHATKRGAFKKALALRAKQWRDYYDDPYRRTMKEGYGKGEKIHWLQFESFRSARKIVIEERELHD